jgi:hypothetical protein
MTFMLLLQWIFWLYVIDTALYLILPKGEWERIKW